MAMAAFSKLMPMYAFSTIEQLCTAALRPTCVRQGVTSVIVAQSSVVVCGVAYRRRQQAMPWTEASRCALLPIHGHNSNTGNVHFH